MNIKQIRLLWGGLLMSGMVWGLAVLPFRADAAEPDGESSGGAGQEAFTVDLADPVVPNAETNRYPVVLELDEKGFPVEYRMELFTGVCLEGVCKPLRVTLFWDALGHYSHLNYPMGDPLTKRSHEPFFPDDYELLDSILKNRDSILGHKPLTYFVRMHEDADDVDAVSSATMKEVQNAVVSGAAYTSWVLWHWVNGDMPKQLTARTALHGSEEYLVQCLQTGDPQYEIFALQQLLSQGFYNEQIGNICFRMLKEEGEERCALAFRIVTGLSPDIGEMQQKLVELIGVNPNSNALILNYFETAATPVPVVWEEISIRLHALREYHNVSSVLELLGKRASDSAVVRENVAVLRGNDNPFVARLAEEFLEN